MISSYGIPFDQVSHLSKTDLDYQLGAQALRPFFRHVPEVSSVNEVIEQRKKFPVDRELLVRVLEKQYREYGSVEGAEDRIRELLDPECFTMVTAHQPCLMTGPLYTITKGISVIQAAKRAEQVSGKRIIPIYIIGGEDHDFEEINHFDLFGEEVFWEYRETGGPVGRIATDTLAPVIDQVSSKLRDSEAEQHLLAIIRETHRPGRSYSNAYADLMQRFLGKYGLLVLQMDDQELKKAFSPVMKKEIRDQVSLKIIPGVQAELESLGYKPQAYVRELNLFYMGSGKRERILPGEQPGQFAFEFTGDLISLEELIEKCELEPENFSPNVVMRPLYQEFILPNLAYIGGGGELAYWLERKSQFDAFGVSYPMLIRRDSVLWINGRDHAFLSEHGISGSRLFDTADEWIRYYLESNSDDILDLEKEKAEISIALDRMIEKGGLLDPTLAKALEAEKVRIMKSAEQIESRIFRTAKQKSDQMISKMNRVKDKLFPGNGLMERKDNMVPFYSKYGDVFFESLLEHLDPFDKDFKVLFEH